jgi:hypothetical protein
MHHPQTRAYAARRTATGASRKEILRLLKRYIVRQVFPEIRHTLSRPDPTPTNSLTKGHQRSRSGSSLVRGTRRNEGQPRSITDTDPAVHRPSRQFHKRAVCRLQRRGHRFEAARHHLDPSAVVDAQALCSSDIAGPPMCLGRQL